MADIITTVDDVANVTGLQTNGGGQPILDPTDNRVLPRQRRRRAPASQRRRAADRRRQYRPAARAARLRQPDRRISRSPGRPTAPATTCGRTTSGRRDRLRSARGRPSTGSNSASATRGPQDYNLFLNSGYEVGAGWELYAFGSYGHRNALSAANYRQQNNARTATSARSRPNQTPTNANFVPLTPNGFLPLIDTTLRDYAGTVGIRGELAGWHTDLSAGRGHNNFDYQVHNTLNTSFGTGQPDRLRRRRAALRPEHLQPRCVARIFGRLRQAADGRGRRRISPRAFPDPAGRPPVLRHRPVVPGRDRQHHAGQLHRAAGRVQRRHQHLQLPGPGSAGAGAQGFPGIPDQQRDGREAGTAMPPMPSSTPTRSRA